MLKVGISSPWGIFAQGAEERRQSLAAVADAGLDHLFIADHVSFRGGSGTDGLVHLAALSGIEPRLNLYLGVFLLALRHPMVAARQVATLAEAAPGRLRLGVGVGGEDRHEFEVCEVDPATRGCRTNAALQILRALLAGDEVDWNDEFYQIDAGLIRPTPAPAVPIIVGGRSNAALDRAGLYGDGWLGAWCSSRRFIEGIERVGAKAASVDRTVDWQHGMQLWVGVGDTYEAAKETVADGMARFYRIPFAPFEKYTPCGTADDIAEFLAPYVEAGATTL
ncbi:MAG: LLM class flavin-dependent oxidoreductase, partial [Acidimicrobiales bacterium]